MLQSPAFSDDDSLLSEAFIEQNYLQLDTLRHTYSNTHSNESGFSAANHTVQTPETPQQNIFFGNSIQLLASAKSNIQESRQAIQRAISSTPIRRKHGQSRTVNMDKLGSCRKFAGYPKENASKFMREFESFCKLHEIDIEPRKLIASFHLHLEGPALAWFEGLSPDLTWGTIKRLFNEKYVSVGWDHPSVVIESEIFHSMELAASQEIEDFYCLIQEKGKLLSKPDHEIMFRFINGLPEKLAFYVRTSQPKNLSEALSYAKQGEAYKYRIHEQCSAISKTQTATRTDDIAELKSQVLSLTKMMQNMSSTENRRLRSDTPIRCFQCNSLGHKITLCNWNGTGNTFPEMVCQLCTQTGHGALQCLQYKPKAEYAESRSRMRVVCQICRKPNHVASECFQLNGQGNQGPLGDTRHGRPGK